MYFDTIPRSWSYLILFILVGQFGISVGTASATPPETSISAYDIPTSELNKVKKKVPVKRTSNASKKKKKSESPAAKSSDSVTPSETSGQAHTPSTVLNSATVTGISPVAPEPLSKPENNRIEQTQQSNGAAAKPTDAVMPPKTTEQATSSSVGANSAAATVASPTASEPPSKSENILIYHTPYSFVVPGKGTIIHAVISNRTDIQQIYCLVPATDGKTQIQVKMEKEAGTQFTYSTVIPGYSADKSQLRYTIVVVDVLGTVTRSQEYVTPVTVSPVVPGWQLEGSGRATLITDQQGDQKNGLKKE
ncbi:MAG: hypothetical protein PHI31_03170 [Desulfuromonadaceae bacterium]|nr:hypothetical protein [Desulfuromonadaceae bacterium]